jgi:hypothetical protein
MAGKLTCDCGYVFRVKDDQAGQKLRCPDCDEVLTVPGARGAFSRPPGRTGSEKKPAPRADLQPGTGKSSKQSRSTTKSGRADAAAEGGLLSPLGRLIAVAAVLLVCGGIWYAYRLPDGSDSGTDDAAGDAAGDLPAIAANWKLNYDGFLANIRPRQLGKGSHYDYAVGFGHLKLGETVTWDVTIKRVDPTTGPVFDVASPPEPCSINWAFAYRDVPRFRRLQPGQKVRITGLLSGAWRAAENPQSNDGSTQVVIQTIPLAPAWNAQNDPHQWDLSEINETESVVRIPATYSVEVSRIKLANPDEIPIPPEEDALYDALHAVSTMQDGLHVTETIAIPRDFDVNTLDVPSLIRIASGKDAEVNDIIGQGRNLSTDAVLLLSELGPRAQAAVPVIVARLEERSGLSTLQYLQVLEKIGATPEQVPLSIVWPVMEQMFYSGSSELAELRTWFDRRLLNSPDEARSFLMESTLSPVFYDECVRLAGYVPDAPAGGIGLPDDTQTLLLLRLGPGDDNDSDYSATERAIGEVFFTQLTARQQAGTLGRSPEVVTALVTVIRESVRLAPGGYQEHRPIILALIQHLAADPELLAVAQPGFTGILREAIEQQPGLEQNRTPYAEELARALGQANVNHEEHAKLLLRFWTTPGAMEGLTSIGRQQPELVPLILRTTAEAKLLLPVNPEFDPRYEQFRNSLDADGTRTAAEFLKRLPEQLETISRIEFFDDINRTHGQALRITLAGVASDPSATRAAAGLVLAAIQDAENQTLRARAFLISLLPGLGAEAKPEIIEVLKELQQSEENTELSLPIYQALQGFGE